MGAAPHRMGQRKDEEAEAEEDEGYWKLFLAIPVF